MTSAIHQARRATADWVLPAMLLAVGGIFVFRGALGLYFTQDDFGGLARASGVLPRHSEVWRYVSVQGYMDVFYPLFRDRPWPYHAVSLGLHCLNAILLFALLSRPLGKPSAFIAASFFVAHPAHFTALYWNSARADILAATFALCTVILALRSDRGRWLAIPAFGLSLLSKESMLFLPGVVAILQWWNGPSPSRSDAGSQRAIDLVLVTLFAASACYLLYLARPDAPGIRIGFNPDAAYAFDFGSSFFRNLLTYVGWTVDLAMLRPGLRFVDRQNPALFPLAIAVLIAAGLLASKPALRRRGWLIGIGGYLLLLLPVLPLRNHAYHYYLYGPLMAAALCVGVLVDSLTALPSSLPSEPKPATAHRKVPFGETVRGVRAGPWVLAALCWLVVTWNGTRVVAQMEARRSRAYPGLRGDPIVDRAMIAERVIMSLRQSGIPPGTHLVFIMRERIALAARIRQGSGEESPPPQEVYPEANVRAALFDGLGVRALVPGVDSVSFVLDAGTPDSRRRYAVYAPTGEVEVFDAMGIDSLLQSSWVNRW